MLLDEICIEIHELLENQTLSPIHFDSQQSHILQCIHYTGNCQDKWIQMKPKVTE